MKKQKKERRLTEKEKLRAERINAKVVGGGNLTILIKLLTYKTDARNIIILDHPSECGFIVLEK